MWVWLAAVALLVSASSARADWTPGVADLQTVATTEVDHDVAVDDAGNGLAVWDAPSGARSVIRARRYDAAAGVWETPDPAATLSNPSTNAWSPAVAVDKAGRATVVWRRPGAPSTIETRRFDSTWGTGPTALSGTTDAEAPAIAVGPRGDALAAGNARPAAP